MEVEANSKDEAEDRIIDYTEKNCSTLLWNLYITEKEVIKI